MAYGHSSGLPPQEAPVVIAEQRKLFNFIFMHVLWRLGHSAHAAQPEGP